MGFFNSNSSWTASSAKYSRIDPSTGRNKRDKSPLRARDTGSRGGGVPRRNGRAVNRAEWRRSQRTGRPIQNKGFWGW
jgi:hypothetical protein